MCKSLDTVHFIQILKPFGRLTSQKISVPLTPVSMSLDQFLIVQAHMFHTGINLCACTSVPKSIHCDKPPHILIC